MRTAVLIDEFLVHCQLRRLAAKTLAKYRWALDRLVLKCPDIPVGEAELLPVLGDQALGATSQQMLLNCLKSFFAWAERTHNLHNPCIGLTLARPRRRLPRVFTHDELGRLFEVADTERDQLLLLVILDCGLRVSEVANLRRSHVRDRWLVITGKVGERRVPVSEELEKRLEGFGTGDRLWIGPQGPLTMDGISQVYRRLCARAGITGPKVGPHPDRNHNDLRTSGRHRCPGRPCNPLPSTKPGVGRSRRGRRFATGAHPTNLHSHETRDAASAAQNSSAEKR